MEHDADAIVTENIEVRCRQDSAKDYMSPQIGRISPHFHYSFEVIFVTDGTAEFNISNQTYTISRGSMLFISNLENHSISCWSDDFYRYTVKVPSRYLNNHIKSAKLISIFKHRSPVFNHHYHCPEDLQIHFKHIFSVMYNEYELQDEFFEQSFANLLYAMLVQLYRRCPDMFPGNRKLSGQNVVYEVQNYIESHMDTHIDLAATAKKFFVDKYHLSHVFKDITGYSFKQYIIMQRIAKAKDILLNTEMPIADIGRNVGFGNVSHFIRTFRKMEGITPYQYRKTFQRHRGEANSRIRKG